MLVFGYKTPTGTAREFSHIHQSPLEPLSTFWMVNA